MMRMTLCRQSQHVNPHNLWSSRSQAHGIDRAFRESVTYRIETKRSAGRTLFIFSGLLDETAFADLAARIQGSASAELVLSTGVEATQAAMAGLRELTVAIHTGSPFLAAWLGKANRSGFPR
jgi:hypothetical protein